MAVLRHQDHDQKQHGEERVYFIFHITFSVNSSSLRDVRAGRQAGQEPAAEAMVGAAELACPFPMAHSACFLMYPQDQVPTVVASPVMNWTLSQQSLIKKTSFPAGQSIGEYFFNSCTLFPNDSSLYQVDITN